MRKGKLLFLLLISFMITGCTVNYDLLVNDKKEVQETIKISNSNQLILNSNDSIDLYLTEQIDAHKNINFFRNYIYSKHVGKNISYVTMTRNYASLKEYTNSPILRQLFEAATVESDGTNVSFKTDGDYYYTNVFGEREQTEPDFFINGVSIKIKFYNKVIDSNADVKNLKNNTLEWIIKSDNVKKSIYFKVGNEKRYDIIVLDFIIRNLATIIISATAVVLLLFIGIYLKSKIYKNNTI